MIVFSKETVTLILQVFYVIAGLITISCAYLALTDKNHPTKYGTGAFWAILGFIFIFGPYIDSFIIGCLVLTLGLLTLTKQVKVGAFPEVPKEVKEERASTLRNYVFVPALSIAVTALVCTFLIKTSGSLIGLGLGGIVGILMALLITKTSPTNVPKQGGRLLQQVGPTAILPQLLAALGALFTKAEVGTVIAQGISSIIPENNLFIGVVFYCLGMALFTMIMGNAFAAFTVITAGIGVPFVLSHGANPAVVGALALTAGYCGTLLTPMAANFNIVPAAILETKNKNRVIIQQSLMAIVMLVVHIFLMYFLGYR